MTNPASVEVELRGVLFRDPGPVLERGGDRIEQEAARFGAEMIRQRLSDVMINPTGNYRSHVVGERRSDFAMITDSGVIYGPWLEGVAARNQNSRFKGYSTFRRSLNDIDAQIPLRTTAQQEQMAKELEAP